MVVRLLKVSVRSVIFAQSQTEAVNNQHHMRTLVDNNARKLAKIIRWHAPCKNLTRALQLHAHATRGVVLTNKNNAARP